MLPGEVFDVAIMYKALMLEFTRNPDGILIKQSSRRSEPMMMHGILRDAVTARAPFRHVRRLTKTIYPDGRRPMTARMGNEFVEETAPFGKYSHAMRITVPKYFWDHDTNQWLAAHLWWEKIVHKHRDLLTYSE